MKPGLGDRPVAFNRRGRDIERGRRLADGQAREEFQFHDVAQARLERGQFRERLVQRQHINRRLPRFRERPSSGTMVMSPPRFRAYFFRA